ncbi:hypothetical protein ACFQ07_08795, partial [Actinomadura adrarensis]
ASGRVRTGRPARHRHLVRRRHLPATTGRAGFPCGTVHRVPGRFRSRNVKRSGSCSVQRFGSRGADQFRRSRSVQRFHPRDVSGLRRRDIHRFRPRDVGRFRSRSILGLSPRGISQFCSRDMACHRCSRAARSGAVTASACPGPFAVVHPAGSPVIAYFRIARPVPERGSPRGIRIRQLDGRPRQLDGPPRHRG